MIKISSVIFKRLIWLAMFVLAYIGANGLAFADCHQNHSCSRVIADNPVTGKVEGNDPFCEAAKAAANKACDLCLASKAAASGTSVACVLCVGAAVASGGAVGPACGAVCGGAGLAQGVANIGGC